VKPRQKAIQYDYSLRKELSLTDFALLLVDIG
jgi:hypothetical protein